MAATGYTPISLYYSTTPAAEPTAGNLVNGELALNITDGKLFYKDNTGTIKSFSGSTATYTRTSFTATSGQTTFTVAYSVGYVEVFLNGVLLNASDYTASNGTTVVLASGAATGDIVETIAYNISAVGTASTATNIAGGIASQLVYQASAGSTAFVANGTSGQYLVSNGTSAPSFANLSIPANTALTTPVITGGKEIRVAVAASDIDLSLGNYFTKTISGTTTFTVSNTPTSGTAASFILDLTNGGSATVNWWSNVKWAGGTAPTLTTSGRDSLGFYTYDAGTTWTGLVLGKDIK